MSSSIHARLHVVSLQDRCRSIRTYFLPKQPLAPSENGCAASKMSVLFSSSHLSGRNSRGESKFAEDRLAATGFVETMVWKYQHSPHEAIHRSRTYASWKVMSINGVAAFRNHSRQCKWKRRVNPHSFKAYCIQVFQWRCAVCGYFVVSLESASHLFL